MFIRCLGLNRININFALLCFYLGLCFMFKEVILAFIIDSV